MEGQLVWGVAILAACFSGLLPKVWEALVRRDKTQVLDHTAIAELQGALKGISDELRSLRRDNEGLRHEISALQAKQVHDHGCIHRIEQELKEFRKEHQLHRDECNGKLSGIRERVAGLEAR